MRASPSKCPRADVPLQHQRIDKWVQAPLRQLRESTRVDLPKRIATDLVRPLWYHYRSVRADVLVYLTRQIFESIGHKGVLHNTMPLSANSAIRGLCDFGRTS